MSIRTKILDKGKIVQEQLIRVLLKFDARITALEGATPTPPTIDDLTDADTVECVVTYTDESTATFNLVYQVAEETTQEGEGD